MRDTQACKATLYDLATEIEASDYKMAIHLRQLGDAVDGGIEASTWSGLDIHRFINPERFIEQYHNPVIKNRGFYALEFIRNILIFLPIAITWLGIAQATSAYYTLITACQQKCSDPTLITQQFLYLWEHSFGGYLTPSWFTLSTIGSLDAGILFVIILLTIAIGIGEGFLNRKHGQRAQELYHNLVDALSEATLCLQSQGGGSHVQPIDNLDKVAKHIDKMAREVLTRFEHVAQQIEAKFDTVTTALKEQFDEAGQQLSQAARDLAEQFNEIHIVTQKQQKEIDTHLHTLGTLINNTSSLAEEIHTAASSLQAMYQKINENISLLVDPVGKLVYQQGDLLTVAQQSVEHLETVTHDLDDLNKQQKEWIEQCLDTLSTLDLSVSKIDTATTSMDDLSKQQKTFLASIEKEREAQSKLAEKLGNIAATHKEALDAIGSGAIHLRQIVTTMSETLRLQASMSDTNTMDVRNIVQGYGRAASMIEQSGQTLQESAVVIFDASRALEDAVRELDNKISS